MLLFFLESSLNDDFWAVFGLGVLFTEKFSREEQRIDLKRVSTMNGIREGTGN